MLSTYSVWFHCVYVHVAADEPFVKTFWNKADSDMASLQYAIECEFWEHLETPGTWNINCICTVFPTGVYSIVLQSYVCGRNFLAVLTLKFFNPSMQQLMTSETLFNGEWLLTCSTLVRLFLRVPIYVPHQIAIRCECFSTQLAGIWFLINMSSVMSKKILLTTIRFAAKHATVCSKMLIIMGS